MTFACQSYVSYGADMKIVNTQTAITQKEGKPELRLVFCTSSHGD